MREHEHTPGCGCDGDCDRREFLGVSTAALGGLMFTSLRADGAEPAAAEDKPQGRQAATVRVAFLYPPSKTFADNPDGWWSWPGNDFDAEGRQRQYTAALRDMEKKLGVQLRSTTSLSPTRTRPRPWPRNWRPSGRTACC